MFEEMLRQSGVSFIRSGVENFQPPKEAMQALYKCQNITARRIRYAPDYLVLLPPLAYYVEVKNSTGIERAAYENYLELNETAGYDVLIVCVIEGKVKYVHIQHLKLEAKRSPIMRLAGHHVPVLADPRNGRVWASPSDMSEADRRAYIKTMRELKQNTSGDDFAFIDFEKTVWLDFQRLIGDALFDSL